MTRIYRHNCLYHTNLSLMLHVMCSVFSADIPRYFFLQKSAFRLIAYFVPRSNREPNFKDPCCYFYIKSNVCLTDQSFVHIIECLDHIPVCTPVSTDCKHWPLIRQITGIGAHKLCRIQIHGVLSNQENTRWGWSWMAMIIGERFLLELYLVDRLKSSPRND